MQRKRRKSVNIGFSNEEFLGTLQELTGIVPVGNLGRETPFDLNDLEGARGSLLLREIFSKFDDGKPSEDKEKNTWKKFHEAETLCEDTNRKAERSFYDSDPFWVGVRERIYRKLGPFSWDEASRHFAFGPGGTTRLTKRMAAAAYKYSGIPETTPGNAVIASCAIAQLPIWKQIVLSTGDQPGDLVKVVPGNSIIAVPKNYKSNRTIAKEPDMNIYVQKGIGSVIRRRLYRLGVNLDDQVPNQRGAREGSATGQLATIDLSMASDTVAEGLVYKLLPIDWCTALEQTRSPVGVLPSGEVIRYQKLSSMGNGYTFELESLIFWAIVQECIHPFNHDERDDKVRVYGDDIVVPTQYAKEVVFRLEEAGFKPNSEKTWIDGPYRESCGKHYFQGYDITPFYVRRPVRSLDRLFLTHNNLSRWLERRNGLIDSTVGALTTLRSLAPAKWREPRLPDGYGDGAFIGSVDELRLDAHPHGWECWQVKALSRLNAELRDDLPQGQLIASLMASVSTHPVVSVPVKLGGVTEKLGISEAVSGIPGRVGGYKEINIQIPRHPPA